MKNTVLAAGIVGLLMPAGIALAQSNAPAPLPPRPGVGRQVPPPPRPPMPMASTTRPTTTPARPIASTSQDWERPERPTSTPATTTPPRYRPTELRAFLRWMFTLPTTTTVGELRSRIDFTGMITSPNAASVQLAVPSDNIFAGMLDFFGFPIAGKSR